MYQDNIVLCGASAYEQKYYFNQDFQSLPEAVKQELQIMCVLYTEDVGGILTLEFDEEGSLQFKTEAAESDIGYDEIGSVLKIKQLRSEKESFWKRWKCTTGCFSWEKRLMKRLRKKQTARERNEAAVENRKCADRKSICAGPYGRGDGPSFPEALQGAGGRADLHGDGERQGDFFHNKNTEALMEIDPGEHPVSLQIFGSEPVLMGEVARSIEERPFDILDINMGCPVPKVVNNGEGSALLKIPLISEIVKSVSSAIKKPVTVKIRIGFEKADVDVVDIARRVEDAGGGGHCGPRQDQRTVLFRKSRLGGYPESEGRRFHSGDWKRGCGFSEKAQAMLSETGCDGVMIGRAVRGNPWIFREMNHYFAAGERMARPSKEEIKEMILRHAKAQIDLKGEYSGIREMRKHVAWYTAGMPHSAALRRESNEIAGYKELEQLLERL